MEQHRALSDISSGVATAVDVLKCLESRLRTLHDAGRPATGAMLGGSSHDLDTWLITMVNKSPN